MRLAISIPVHEASEVVVDQLRNIRKYAPEATVILHVSKSNSTLKSQLSDLASDFISEGQLIINPEQLQTTNSNLLATHVSNFHFVDQKGSFDYFCLGASNELLVRPGLADYISKYDAGVESHNARFHRGWWHALTKDPLLASLLRKHAPTVAAHHPFKIVKFSQVEGSFYRFDIARKLMTAIRNDYPVYGAPEYPREEYLPSTLFHTYYGSNGVRVGRPYVLMPWDVELKITQGMIDGIVTGRPGFRTKIRNAGILKVSSHRSGARWILGMIRTTDWRALFFGFRDFFAPAVTHLFGVKRIPRVFGDPLREYVRRLP